MNICLVSFEYPPFRGGGIGTYTYNLGRLLSDLGHEVHIIANKWVDFEESGSESNRDTLSNHVHVHRIDALTKEYKPRPPYDQKNNLLGKVREQLETSLFWSILVAEKLKEVCRNYAIDVIEFPECFAEGYIALHLKKLGIAFSDIPMTVTIHSPIYEVTKYNLYRTYETWFLRRVMMEDYCILHADMLSCPGQAMADIVRKRLNLDPAIHPCDVIRNPVELDDIEKLRTNDNRESEGSESLLFVGRIEPRKGVKYLVDAAVKVMTQRPSLKVYLIGKDCDAGEVPGSMIGFLRSRIPESYESRFIFEGRIPRKEVLARYASATACVFPAAIDNFPYTCVEAMACGACVIATDSGGMAEMIDHGKTGFLFKAKDVDALAGSMLRILQSKDLRAKMRQNAPAAIRKLCNPTAIGQEQIRHYQKTIEKHQHANKTRQTNNTGKTPKVAVFIPNKTKRCAILKTIKSAVNAAIFAGFEINISIIGTAKKQALKALPKDIKPEIIFMDQTNSPEDNAPLALWLDRVEPMNPDYIMTLWPGTALDKEYFSTTHRILTQTPNAAWATTWAKAATLWHKTPYAGFDFSVPLELIYYNPVPLALIRYDAYKKTGGWNHSLPPYWHKWDLWLAFYQAGLQGIVVPVWQASYIPGPDTIPALPLHEKTFEMILDAVSSRNRQLFKTYANQLWKTQILAQNDISSLPNRIFSLLDRWKIKLAKTIKKQLGKLLWFGTDYSQKG